MPRVFKLNFRTNRRKFKFNERESSSIIYVDLQTRDYAKEKDSFSIHFATQQPPYIIRGKVRGVNALNKPRGIEKMMRRIRHGLLSAVSLANCELLKEGRTPEDCHRRITVFRRKGRISRGWRENIELRGWLHLAAWNW